jgi:hypothetical protein
VKSASLSVMLMVSGPVWLLAAGCTTAPRAEVTVVADGQELPVLRQKSGAFSSITRRLRLVVHDPGTLAMLPVDPGPVNFSHEMVLLAAMGPTPSDDYAIRIRRVWREGSVLRARVEKRFPRPDAPRGSAPASPYHLVVVPRSELNVRGFEAGVPPGTLDRSGRGNR